MLRISHIQPIRKKNICMMNQELTARKRSPIKALYVLLGYVIALLLDEPGQTKDSLSVHALLLKYKIIVSPFFSKRKATIASV